MVLKLPFNFNQFSIKLKSVVFFRGKPKVIFTDCTSSGIECKTGNNNCSSGVIITVFCKSVIFSKSMLKLFKIVGIDFQVRRDGSRILVGALIGGEKKMWGIAQKIADHSADARL